MRFNETSGSYRLSNKYERLLSNNAALQKLLLAVPVFRFIIPFFAVNSLHCHYFFIVHFNYLKIVLTFIEISTHSCYMLHSVNMFILNEYDDDGDGTIGPGRECAQQL